MRTLKCLLMVLLAIAANNGVQGKSALPSFLKICSRSDPNLSRCIIDSVYQLRPLLAQGIPEFDIPPCEPLVIPEVTIDQGHGPISVKSCYRDIRVYGPSQFQIKGIRIELDKGTLQIKLFLPKLSVNAYYNMNGQIMMMPINGAGLSLGNYTNIDAILTMKARNIQKDEEIYFHIQDCTVDFNIGHAQLYFQNLFNGNKELGDAMNSFLNNNWKTVSSEIKPILEDRLAEIFKKFANKIFHKHPISVLFTE
ncbi:protein takeout-like [Rhynchophorus ferrugineus]|uniref:Protein takeout n=1 Tax=Rhynchophorus ferrugineus TaxID=354439 RepID=A0A834IR10_RHYFE|nr:hypothetical protein GWI33_002594 [Rhynchophorus ferrugineus]